MAQKGPKYRFFRFYEIIICRTKFFLFVREVTVE